MNDLDKYYPVLNDSEKPLKEHSVEEFLDRFFEEESPITLHEPLVQTDCLAANAVVKSAKEMENLDSYND